MGDRASRDEILRERVEHVAAMLRDALRDGRLDGDDVDICVREVGCAAEGAPGTTLRHLRRVGLYVEMLAHAMRWPEDRCRALGLASQLHDIGKVGLPDEVLSTAGVLTRDDRQVMERHTRIGHDLLAGLGAPLLDLAAVVALNHHERYDGRGYPNGLTGTAIPVEGRIVAIVDVFDALTTERRYKPAMSINQARVLMLASRGSHFDARLLDLFLDQQGALEDIRRTWGDPRTPRSARPRSVR